MKPAAHFILAACMFVSPVFASQGSAQPTAAIKAPSPSSRAVLDLYEQPKSSSPTLQIQSTELQYPVTVTKTQPGFSAISYKGKTYWVRNSQVRLERDSSAKCAPVVARGSGLKTAQTPGVHDAVCGH